MFIFFGAFLVFIGFLFSITIVGAVIGIPLIMVGSAFILFGLFFGRRKTIINNVVTVQNAAAPASSAPAQSAPATSTSDPAKPPFVA